MTTCELCGEREHQGRPCYADLRADWKSGRVISKPGAALEVRAYPLRNYFDGERVDSEEFVRTMTGAKTAVEMVRKVYGMDDQKTTVAVSLNYNLCEIQVANTPEESANPQVVDIEATKQIEG